MDFLPGVVILLALHLNDHKYHLPVTGLLMFEVRECKTCPESPCSMKQLSGFVSRALLSFGCPSLLLVSVPCTICWGHDGSSVQVMIPEAQLFLCGLQRQTV